MAGRLPKFDGRGKVRSILFPLDLLWAIDSFASREGISAADLVRREMRLVIERNAGDLLEPDDPEVWGDSAWKAHADRHDRFLRMPYDPKCKKCQIRYKDWQDFAKKFYGIGSAKSAPRSYIDKGYGSRVDPRSEKILSTGKAEELTDEDNKIIRDHAATSGHTDKGGNILAWNYQHDCELCAELVAVAEREKEINRNKNRNEADSDRSDTQIQE